MIAQTQEFTPAEAAALVNLSEQEVRQEIEYKLSNWIGYWVWSPRSSPNGTALYSPPV